MRELVPNSDFEFFNIFENFFFNAANFPFISISERTPVDFEIGFTIFLPFLQPQTSIFPFLVFLGVFFSAQKLVEKVQHIPLLMS